MDIQRAVNHILSPGFRLPYGVMPGSFPGGEDSEFDEARWLAYQWNPPEGLAHLPEFSEPDPNVSVKFSWQQIVQADGVAEIEEAREDLLRQLNEIATARIASLYHPDAAQNRNKEWQVRLSGVSLTVQDTERIRLIAVHDNLAAQLTTAATLTDLEAIDLTDDAIWVNTST